MSRIGKRPIKIPSNVTVTYENNVLKVKGSKGELSFPVDSRITIEIIAINGESTINISRSANEGAVRALHGLTRAIIANMIKGVTEGFTRRLEVNGVGYRFQIQGKKIVLTLGYSHPVEYHPLEGVELKADEEKKNIIIVSGIDKQKVGAVAAKIRSFRKPEPYKGKGIKYEEEYIKRKAGKAAAKA